MEKDIEKISHRTDHRCARKWTPCVDHTPQWGRSHQTPNWPRNFCSLK